uniref:Uncharacterized protein n=1 Tax=Anguilla anguilla TaxID=7936 RepID=A0A0E9WGV2_ANGAN
MLLHFRSLTMRFQFIWYLHDPTVVTCHFYSPVCSAVEATNQREVYEART